MHKYKSYRFSHSLLIITLAAFYTCSVVPKPSPATAYQKYVSTGLDVLEREGFSSLKNLSVGLIINQTSVNRLGVHILMLISPADSVRIGKIFSPEHGFRGMAEAGEPVSDDTLSSLNIPVISLYGDHKKPTPEDLSGVDVLLFDIADAGSRYYTYVSTLTYVMEAAAGQNIPVIVLDRPNPIRGDIVDGPVLQTDFRSFVGLHPIPARHGMTIGELALMINESGWLENGYHCNLTVVPMENWRRSMWFDETHLPWIPPSPNIPDDTTALIYDGFCLLEGTNISEGRGTYDPFKLFGAPWADSHRLASILNELNLPGVQFSPVDFTPVSIPGKSKWPKYLNQPCHGCRMYVTNRDRFSPLRTAVNVIGALHEEYPDHFEFLESEFIDLLYGSDKLRTYVTGQKDLTALFKDWDDGAREFINTREKYLLY